jgi:ABC-type transporter Mla subunit MlaD
MNEARNNFFVGLFVLGGVAALIAMLILFSKNAAFRVQPAQYALQVHFDRTTGIREGRQVTIGGIQVGRVGGVRFADPANYAAGVLIELLFDQPMNLTEGTRVRTVEPGLGMGLPPIEIDPGPRGAPALASGARIDGSIRSAVESLLPGEVVAPFSRSATQIGEAAEQLTPVLDVLFQLLEPRSTAAVDAPGGPEGNLATAAARLDQSFKHFNAVLGDPQVQTRLRETIDNLYAVSVDARQAAGDVKAVAADLKQIAPQLTQTLDKTQQTVGNIDTNVNEVSKKAVENLDLLAGSLRSVQAVAARTERGEGSLGLLTSDARLYESTVLTMQRLAAATEELRLLIADWQKGKIKVGF